MIVAEFYHCIRTWFLLNTLGIHTVHHTHRVCVTNVINYEYSVREESDSGGNL